ncbi:hypothetical protein [Mucilaginibacter xinganensis]|uniref:Uncharacterized protein n=1 Tax=Mucilaginibacter xinganensis TaxID=1234841 RepID=A0A223NQP4_9SPHI|nr:hypothetical protein [Mucilaginibacter xinganensis]ASU32014.1 hypothetical protein MuYL_0111 [Mucilaginibacter xinganensis]
MTIKRIFLPFILTSLCTSTFGQTNFNSLIKNVTVAKLPYSTAGARYRHYRENQKEIHSTDSVFIIKSLKSILPKVVNPQGGTAFGSFDCDEDTTICLQPEEIAKIAIICVIKNNYNSNWLIHMEYQRKGDYGLSRGLLLNISPQGNLNDWIISNGSLNEGNPHGNIFRNFTVPVNGSIRIEESAEGDNTDKYVFYTTYKILQGKFRPVYNRFIQGTHV